MTAIAQQISIKTDSYLKQYRDWCHYDMLPWWLENGIDRQKGGFFEQFDLQGNADRNCTRRVRVASRQIYSFSHAHTLGWTDAKATVLNGIDWLIERTWGKNNEPGFLARVDDDGKAVDQTRDLYDHAFHILALATAYQATKDQQILGMAKNTLDFVEEALSAKNGGWFENQNYGQPRRQNPHMHMFEALLAMFEVSGDTAYLKRADQVAQLLFEQLIDSKTRLLFEFFDTNWKPQIPAQIEPGHMVEWAWLLHRRNSFAASHLNISAASKFLQFGESIGIQENGLLIDTCNIQREPITNSSRLWVQTEWLKALLIAPGQSQQIEHVCQQVFQHYINLSHPALWVDAVNSKNQPIVDKVPASVVYHLISAAAQAEENLSTINSRNIS
ncbi:MAG: AGE family epimerase/isomerase [Robiginitomaculum sp.]|nr:AGE family epimerase/isomerase [Robiginitomaculum sp.]